jgi:hypothetical protein
VVEEKTVKEEQNQWKQKNKISGSRRTKTVETEEQKQ